MGYSKRPHPRQIPLLVFLNIGQSEADLCADFEISDTVDAVAGDPVNGVDGNFPAPGELALCEDGLCYVLDERGRISVVH